MFKQHYYMQDFDSSASNYHIHAACLVDI